MCGIIVIINKDLQPINLQKCKKSLKTRKNKQIKSGVPHQKVHLARTYK